MKRFIQWTALTALVISVSSCGLPGAVVRTAGNAVTTARTIVPTATGSLTTSGNTTTATGAGSVVVH